jgi:hypothetical protein
LAVEPAFFVQLESKIRLRGAVFAAPGVKRPIQSIVVGPLTFAQLTVTDTPAEMLVGLDVSDAAATVVTVKLPLLEPLPPAVVTAIFPVFAPVGTVAVICVALLTVKAVAAVLLNLTAVAPVKFVPLTVTLVPTGPLVGVNDVTVGVGTTVKLPLLVAVPPGAVTAIGPLVVPFAGCATIVVSELTLKLFAFVPLNFTAVAPVKPEPLTVTFAPTLPLVGVKPEIETAGGGEPPVTVKLPALVAEPDPVVTEIWPSVAPDGTVATSRESRTTAKAAEVPLNFTKVAPAR